MGRLVLKVWERVQACVALVSDSTHLVHRAEESRLWPEVHNPVDLLAG
jgi:hypothetical protein